MHMLHVLSYLPHTYPARKESNAYNTKSLSSDTPICFSPSSFRSYERPAAAFHYNCQPRGSRGRAFVLLARSGYRPGAQAEAQRTRTSMGERSGLLS